jgi:hypothetical protein
MSSNTTGPKENSMKHRTRRAVISLTAGAALATAIIMGDAASAQARRPHTFKICAYGNYAAYAEIPQQRTSTVIAHTGQCVQITTPASTTYAKVWGFWNTHPQDRFYVGTAHFKGADGYTGGANGTTGAPTLVNFN